MKHTTSESLASHREEIIARITAQRTAFAFQNETVIRTLGGVDLGVSLVHRIKKSPVMMMALVAVVVVIKPRRIFSLVNTGMAIWQTVRLLESAPTEKL